MKVRDTHFTFDTECDFVLAGTGRLLVRTARAWNTDRCGTMAAALAFYATFSLAPTIVIVIAVAGFFFGADAVRGLLFAEIRAIVGPDGAMAIQAILAHAWKSDQGVFASLWSLGGMLLGATGTFNELSGALRLIWRTGAPRTVLTDLLRVRLLSFGLVIGIGFLVVVLLIADAAIVYATDFLFSGSILRTVLDPLQQGLSFLFLCAAFSLLLKVLPECPVEMPVAAAGGIAAAGLFTLGKRLFAVYLAHASATSVFGAASSLAVLMMWLFFSAAVFLLGAEFAAQLAHRQSKGEFHKCRSASARAPWLLR